MLGTRSRNGRAQRSRGLAVLRFHGHRIVGLPYGTSLGADVESNFRPVELVPYARPGLAMLSEPWGPQRPINPDSRVGRMDGDVVVDILRDSAVTEGDAYSGDGLPTVLRAVVEGDTLCAPASPGEVYRGSPNGYRSTFVFGKREGFQSEVDSAKHDRGLVQHETRSEGDIRVINRSDLYRTVRFHSKRGRQVQNGERRVRPHAGALGSLDWSGPEYGV